MIYFLIDANVLEFDSYRVSELIDEGTFYEMRLRLGKIFVSFLNGGRVLFCPSRFAGYKNNTMFKHLAFEYKDGRKTTPCINRALGVSHGNDEEAENEYLLLCKETKIEPSSKNRTYWRIDTIESTSAHSKIGGEFGFPDEVSKTISYMEGAVKMVFVNVYERSPRARKVFLNHFGFDCAVYGFNFKSIYGVIGQKFIHVHHLTPLATRDAQYQIDALTDLRPICPNCHAMLHTSDPPFSIEELKDLMNSSKINGQTSG